jgi:predicted nuclease of restriction endonuclease-like (RecB) superfamily
MSKKLVTKKTTLPKKQKSAGLASLIAEVRNLIESARHAAASAVNTLQVLTNFEIGRRIVEHEQKGAKRAAYGAELLNELSTRLTEEFGKGFSPVNLSYMRRFFLLWKERVRIFQQPTEKSFCAEIGQLPTDQPAICQQPTDKLAIFKQSIRKSPFVLSWTHYVLLLTVKDPDERSFYEIEASREGWSVPELKRQKASALYERLALSRDKKSVKQLAEKGQIITRPEDIL